MFFFRAEIAAWKQITQTNVDDNHNSLGDALYRYLSLSDDSPVAASPVTASSVCPMCGVSYSPKTGYLHHKKIHHMPSAREDCTHCISKFYSQELYKQHMKEHKRRIGKGKK